MFNHICRIKKKLQCRIEKWRFCIQNTVVLKVFYAYFFTLILFLFCRFHLSFLSFFLFSLPAASIYWLFCFTVHFAVRYCSSRVFSAFCFNLLLQIWLPAIHFPLLLFLLLSRLPIYVVTCFSLCSPFPTLPLWCMDIIPYFSSFSLFPFAPLYVTLQITFLVLVFYSLFTSYLPLPCSQTWLPVVHLALLALPVCSHRAPGEGAASLIK